MGSLGFMRRTLVLAAFLGALGVVLGAYSAHGLERQLQSRGLGPETVALRLETMETGVRYHLFHVLALVGWVSVAEHANAKLLRSALRTLFVGLLVFSGSLYLLVFLNVPKFGAVTPVGGVVLIAGWVLAGWAAIRGPATFRAGDEKGRGRKGQAS